jgi:glucose-1-phosphate cytidylyltransferase
MKAIILAGGRGSRLGEETTARPKPMVEIGGRPILWHIMKTYSHHGIHDFIICLGYKGYMIKEYFANYFLHSSDVTIDLCKNNIETHASACEPWRVTLVDTGESTMTGGRLRRVLHHVADEDAFCFTYGDGVADIDISALIEFHRQQGRLVTVTAAQPVGRYGALAIAPDLHVSNFAEKPKGDGGWINGGYFVLSPKVADYLVDDATIWENEPLERLAAAGEISAYKHSGFWRAMDTLFDKTFLEELWQSGKRPWKVW